MGLLGMATRSLKERWLTSALTAVGVALGVALVAVVLLLERESYRAFTGTAHGVEILVAGDKGGRLEALLSALYHVGRAPGRVPWSCYEELRADPDVAYAIPLAYGDRYRGLPVVGTTDGMFTRFRPRPGVAFEIEGTGLGAERGAVVGAEAARLAGLAVGDTFVPSHSGAEDDPRHRDERFLVTGIARATGTAHDRVIWVRLADFLALKGHAGLARADGDERAVSAVLVKTKDPSPVVVEGLIRRLNDGGAAQAIRPLQVVGELWTLVGGVQRILQAVAWLVIAVAALSVMVSLHNTMAERRREIAILRALGASRGRVFGAVLAEAALLCGVGAALGLVLGHGGAALAAPLVEAQAGIRIDSFALLPQEPLLVVALLVVGALAGLAPALAAYRVDVAATL